MTPFFLLLAFMFGQGFLHGLGPDHLAAITALCLRGASGRQAALLGLKFGLGHMVTLAGVGGFAIAIGWAIPEGFERRMEILGGLILIALGLWLLADVFRKGPVVHAHVHVHADPHEDVAPGRPHEHVHVHEGPPEAGAHLHRHAGTLLGGVFALSGVRSLLTMLPPVALAKHLWQQGAYIAVFGFGIVLSMSLYGVGVARALKAVGAHQRVTRLAVLAGALLSLGLGAYWVASNVQAPKF